MSNQAIEQGSVLIASTAAASDFTSEQIETAKRLRAYYPYLIVWLALSPTGEFECMASATKRFLNQRIRQGWKGAVLQ